MAFGQRGGHPFFRHAPALAGAWTVVALMAPGNASAYSFKVLHDFCRHTNCADGGNPLAGVLEDGSGNLYGTGYGGGTDNGGVVFKLIPDGAKYSYHIIKKFCAKPGCADGQNPQSGVVMDADGDVWGTTYYGGKYGLGVLFELTPAAHGWSYRVIHNFGNGSDGANPAFGLTYAGQQADELWGEGFEPAFGTTSAGGTFGHGAVYELLRRGSSWTYKVIHNTDTGAYPNELAMDSAGNLFDTTSGGGPNGAGLMYRLDSGTWKETTLYQFCSQTHCDDGQTPVGRLWIDESGNLFGATAQGGNTTNCTDSGCGTAFEYTSGGTYRVLYNFCLVLQNGVCADGNNPQAGVIMNGAGALFGTSFLGDPNQGGGTAFELAKGQSGTWQFTLIGSPSVPLAPLALDPNNGNLYGTGDEEAGIVFVLRP